MPGAATARLTGRLAELSAAAPGDFYGKPTRFVGRRAELGQRLEALEPCAEERQSVLWTLVAPAGLGKARLCEELHSALRRLDEPTLTFHGQVASNPATSHDLVTSLLRCKLRIAADEPSEIVAR